MGISTDRTKDGVSRAAIASADYPEHEVRDFAKKWYKGRFGNDEPDETIV
jgi:hypothetical protein